jgi:hypothetical protein
MPRIRAVLPLAALLAVSVANAQRVYTTQDYKNAERWMGYNLAGLVTHTVSDVKYLPDGRLRYNDDHRRAQDRGSQVARSGSDTP